MQLILNSECKTKEDEKSLKHNHPMMEQEVANKGCCNCKKLQSYTIWKIWLAQPHKEKEKAVNTNNQFYHYNFYPFSGYLHM